MQAYRPEQHVDQPMGYAANTDSKVYCLDPQTGRIKWQQTAYKGVPKVKRHTKASHCNSTPAIFTSAALAGTYQCL